MRPGPIVIAVMLHAIAGCGTMSSPDAGGELDAACAALGHDVCWRDGSGSDGGTPDAHLLDAVVLDASELDAARSDAAIGSDASARDVGIDAPADAGASDVGVDAPRDAGPLDAGAPDTGPIDSGIAMPCASDLMEIVEVRGTNAALPRMITVNGRSAIYWQEQRPATSEVWLGWLDASFVLDEASVHVVTPDDGATSAFAHAVWNGTDIGIVYSDDRAGTPSRAVYFARLDASGAPITNSERPFGVRPLDQDWPAIAWDSARSEWGVTWSQHESGHLGVRFARLDAMGSTIAGSDIQLALDSGYGEPSDSGNTPIVWNGTDFVVAWSSGFAVDLTSIALDGTTTTSTFSVPMWSSGQWPARVVLGWSGTSYEVAFSEWWFTQYVGHAARVDPSGFVAGTNVALGDPSVYSGETSVVWTGTDWALAWTQAGHVWTARIDATGAIETGTRRQVTCDAGYDGFASIHWDGSALSVVTDRTLSGTDSEIVLVRLP